MTDERHESLWRQVAQHVATAGGGWAEAVCAIALTTVPPVDGAAVSARSSRRSQEVLAATDAWTSSVEEVHYALGTGPSVEAFDSGGPVLVPDLGAEKDRWQAFVDSATALGAGALFAFPMQLGVTRLGTLTLYRRTAGPLARAHLANAAILADVAALGALADARDAEQRKRTPVPEATPVGGYQDVHVATGMLAAQLGIPLDDAFARLQAHTFSAGRSLLEVSRDVLNRRLRLDS